MSYMSRAKEKTTNLALTVVIVFFITNTPFMVIEFMRQGIISKSWYVLVHVLTLTSTGKLCSYKFGYFISKTVQVSGVLVLGFRRLYWNLNCD